MGLSHDQDWPRRHTIGIASALRLAIRSCPTSKPLSSAAVLGFSYGWQSKSAKARHRHFVAAGNPELSNLSAYVLCRRAWLKFRLAIQSCHCKGRYSYNFRRTKKNEEEEGTRRRKKRKKQRTPVTMWCALCARHCTHAGYFVSLLLCFFARRTFTYFEVPPRLSMSCMEFVISRWIGQAANSKLDAFSSQTWKQPFASCLPPQGNEALWVLILGFLGGPSPSLGLSPRSFLLLCHHLQKNAKADYA